MPDINKFIGDTSVYDEAREHLLDLEDWNEDIARAHASELGIELGDAHWEVVNFLRQHYIEHGKTDRARRLTEVLDAHFADKGGTKYLYRLFPDGPILQASRIAGVPAPKDTTQPSFGSAQ